MNRLTGPASRSISHGVRIAAFSLAFVNATSACEMLNEDLASWDSVVVSGYYWIASMILGAIIVGLVVYHRRWLWSPVVITVLLLVHPTWTVAPLHGPDCSYLNVEASQALLASIGLLLAYQLFSIFRSSRKVLR